MASSSATAPARFEDRYGPRLVWAALLSYPLAIAAFIGAVMLAP